MKISNLLFSIVLLLSTTLIMNSCQQERTTIDLEDSISKTYLFDKLEISTDANGVNTFVETDETKIKNILNTLIIKKQDVLTKIDEFGFKMSKGDNPRELFYIKEYANEKVITASYFLDGETEANSATSVDTRQGPIAFYLCVTGECCQSSDLTSNYNCICYDINEDCNFNGGNPSCSKLTIIVGRN